MLEQLRKFRLPGSKHNWFVSRSGKQLPDAADQNGRLRIAFLVNSFPLLSETFVLNQITGLINRGHSVDIYASRFVRNEKFHEAIHRYGLIYRTHYLSDIPSNYLMRLLKVLGLIIITGAWRHPGVLIRSVNFFKYGRMALSLYILYNALPFLREKPYDILHCQFGFTGPLGLCLKQIGAFNGRLVTSFRGIDITQNLLNHPGLYDELFREGDYFLPVSKKFRQRLIREGCPEYKIEVLYSGVDCSHFSFAERRREENDLTRILTIGRLVEKKGIVFGMKAVASVIKAGHDIRYTIVGDGKLKAELRDLAIRLNIGQHVVFTGWLTYDEIVGQLEASHILLAPSITDSSGDSEGIPNSAKEAMAMGLPVVSTLHSGIPELIEDGKSGFLVPERDENALADRLEYLILHPEIWPQMGRVGRKCIENKFDINKLNDKLVKIYQQLTEQSAIAISEKEKTDGRNNNLSKAYDKLQRLNRSVKKTFSWQSIASNG